MFHCVKTSLGFNPKSDISGARESDQPGRKICGTCFGARVVNRLGAMLEAVFVDHREFRGLN
jgi:hypothetical protein